jgi:hypothetical protein
MTSERWMSLEYDDQKKVLVAAVSSEEDLDWLSVDLLQVFFEESFESECKVRRFVDIRNIRNFFGNSELDDFDNDFGLDAFQYRSFTSNLFENLGEVIFNSDESAELVLLDSIGSTFVTQTRYSISTYDGNGEHVSLFFTKNEFTDGRYDEVVFPCSDLACHEFIDDFGEWMEVGGEIQDHESYESALIESILDVEEKIDDATSKAIDDEAFRELDEAFEGGFSLPGAEVDDSVPGRRLGDALFD